MIDELVDNGAGRSIRFLADHRVDEFGKLAGDVLAKEVSIMNGDLSLPKRLLVRVEACDAVNAFYDPESARDHHVHRVCAISGGSDAEVDGG